MLHIRLTEKCNFKCVFCHIPQIKPRNLEFIDVLKEVMKVDHSQPTSFCFSGGEPTAVPYFPKLIKFVKKCNPNHHISIETNGFFLSNLSYTEELVHSGLNSILLSFHSHKEDVFEKITGIKGSFRIMQKTLEVLKNFNLDIEISYVLCKYNYKDLPDMVRYLNENTNFKGILVANIFEEINYKTKSDYHVSLEDVEPYILDGYDLLKSYGKKIDTCGVPMCYLKGYEDTYYLGQYEKGRYYRKDSTCKDCLFDDNCRGIIGDFADLYGTSSVKPVSTCSEDLLKKLHFLKQEYFNSSGLRVNNSSDS